MEPIKIDKWDGSALKNTLDDSCKATIIEKYGYSESHWLMDIRLAICTGAVGCALFALLYDYLYAFPASISVLTICSVSYFILTGILTLYTTLFEKGIFLVAKKVDPTGTDGTATLTVSSCLRRFEPDYSLCFEYHSGKKGSKLQTATITKLVSHWFDEDGFLAQDVFEKDVSNLHDSITRKKTS
ncbi:signal peptidase complex subunit Spase25 [Brevipalpus obovatus]|uniref:signal peptidase complex subunit Spase25 n=1 Tax=Brevipalpus obovatus TaxID=246614 RepID=UPI003D9E26AC